MPSVVATVRPLALKSRLSFIFFSGRRLEVLLINTKLASREYGPLSRYTDYNMRGVLVRGLEEGDLEV